MNFRVVSYYTYNTLYESIIINYLMPCLQQFHIPHFIPAIHNRGKWKDNVGFQPAAILQAMNTFTDEAIIWMDADTIIRNDPKLFVDIPDRCDIGVYYLKFEDHWGGVPPGVETPKPLLNTGIIYFKNSPKMLKFVKEWCKRSDNGGNHKDHLQKMIDERINDDLSLFLIPREYSYIAEREDGLLPVSQLQDPIIVQFSPSRYAKIDLLDPRPFFGVE